MDHIDKLMGSSEKDDAPVEETAVEEVKAEEAEEPEVKAEPEEEEKTRVVPHEALHAEREKRKAEAARREEIQKELQAAHDRAARMEERFEKMMASLQGPREEPPVDFDSDPAGYLKRTTDDLNKRFQELSEKDKSQARMLEQQRQAQAVAARVKADIQSFEAEHPDYQDAYRFLMTQVDKELQLSGVTDPNRRMAELGQREWSIAAAAMESGNSPASVVYELAKSRGYAMKTDPMETLKAGEKASQTLSATPSGSSKSKISLEELSRLDGAEFDKAWERLRQSGGLG